MAGRGNNAARRRGPAPKRAARPPAQSARRSRRRRGPRVGPRLPYTGSLALSVFSPLHPGVVPSQLPEGNAFPVKGMVRGNFVTDATTGWLLLIGQTGQSANVMLSWSNVASPVSTSYAVPTLTLADDAGGPASGRAMKVGFTMVNSSPSTSVSGLVYVLPASQRLLLPAAAESMTQANVTAVMTAVKAHPETQIFGANNFVQPRAFFAHVVDDILYSSYEAWQGTETRNDFALHAAIWPGANPSARPMNFFWVYIDSTSLGNTYTVTVEASYYTRWPLGTIMAQNEVPVPLAPLPTVVAQRKVAETTGSTGLELTKQVAGGVWSGMGLPTLQQLGAVYQALPTGSGAAAVKAMRSMSSTGTAGIPFPYKGYGGLLGAIL